MDEILPYLLRVDMSPSVRKEGKGTYAKCDFNQWLEASNQKILTLHCLLPRMLCKQVFSSQKAKAVTVQNQHG